MARQGEWQRVLWLQIWGQGQLPEGWGSQNEDHRGRQWWEAEQAMRADGGSLPCSDRLAGTPGGLSTQLLPCHGGGGIMVGIWTPNSLEALARGQPGSR